MRCSKSQSYQVYIVIASQLQHMSIHSLRISVERCSILFDTKLSLIPRIMQPCSKESFQNFIRLKRDRCFHVVSKVLVKLGYYHFQVIFVKCEEIVPSGIPYFGWPGRLKC